MGGSIELKHFDNDYNNKTNTCKCDKKEFFKIYTITFIFVIMAIFSPFWIADKTFIWVYDGMVQHYRALAYYGEWLKLLVKTVFIDHSLSVPTFSFGIGYGSDLFTTLHYYAIGDPFTVLSVLFPLKYQFLLYNALIVMKLYFAGIAFASYCFYVFRKTTMLF